MRGKTLSTAIGMIHTPVRRRFFPLPNLSMLLVDPGNHLDQNHCRPAEHQGSGQSFHTSKQPPFCIMEDHVAIAHSRIRDHRKVQAGVEVTEASLVEIKCCPTHCLCHM